MMPTQVHDTSTTQLSAISSFLRRILGRFCWCRGEKYMQNYIRQF